MLPSLLQAESFLLVLTALSAALPNDLSAPKASDAVVRGFLFPTCGGSRLPKPLNVPVDRCFTTPTLALKIESPAICANGTRAKLARFPEKGCGYGTLDSKLGLIDVEDSDVGDCKMIRGFESMAFWCDGLKKTSPPDDDGKTPEPEDKSKKGTTSESACMDRKAPFFTNRYADTCVGINYNKMRVIAAAICANGTRSTLALYDNRGCYGEPAEFRTVDDSERRTCQDVTNMRSYAFYCSGEGLGKEEPVQKPVQKSGGLGTLLLILFFMLVITLLSLFCWIRKIGGYLRELVSFVRNLMKPKDGAIAI